MTLIDKGSLVFSPDSQRLAYVPLNFSSNLGFLKLGRKSMVVIDELEGAQFERIVTSPNGSSIFESTNRLRYIGRKGNSFYQVEEHVLATPSDVSQTLPGFKSAR